MVAISSQVTREAYMVAVHCRFCGQSFLAKSRKAQFCSAAHKQNFYRWRKRLPSTGDKAGQLISEVGSYLDFDLSRGAALEILHLLHERILGEVQKRNIKFVK